MHLCAEAYRLRTILALEYATTGGMALYLRHCSEALPSKYVYVLSSAKPLAGLFCLQLWDVQVRYPFNWLAHVTATVIVHAASNLPAVVPCHHYLNVVSKHIFMRQIGECTHE